jgi:hypothetical protein
MNGLLWVLQILLAVWNLIGGCYVATNYAKIGNSWALGILPATAWMVLSGVQILFALGLFWSKAISIAAIGLAVISLLGLGFYTQYAGFPGMLWGVVPALLLAFIAYGRIVLKPF